MKTAEEVAREMSELVVQRRGLQRHEEVQAEIITREREEAERRGKAEGPRMAVEEIIRFRHFAFDPEKIIVMIRARANKIERGEDG